MSNFSQDIQNFRRYGTYEYKFDNVGNMIFNSSSMNFNQVYLALPLVNPVYNNSKINTLYNTNFQEFVPQVVEVPISSVDDLQQKLNVVEQENSTLKEQLDSIISQTTATDSSANEMAAKQVILELRKAVGEGRVDSDFSDTFPYTPVKKNKT